MAVSATLTFKGAGGGSQASLKVLDFDFGFTQQVDSTGKPTGRPLITNINLNVETTEDTQIIDWMTSFGATKDGTIEVNLKNNVRKTIKFEKAYCVYYHESYNAHGEDQAMHISFTISPENVEIDDNIFISNI